MGVPALFRWLSKKYPKIVTSVVLDEPVIITHEDGTTEEIPVDTTGPNPNGEEFDNLYLDMNGIVHPCTHPEGKPAPKNEEEMMHEIFLYTDRVVNMVRPRKLLMMAIDGVAPRAKMNQQRSRRFRSAEEAKVKEEERIKAIAEQDAMGKPVSDEFRNEKGWDSNAITPGTPFMELLAKSLRYWVAKKLNEDPGWAGLQIIISDSSVPGEGEHKIMDFIRRQRSHSSHDPNTKHVIYGLDADLIMLSLATHEPNFKVLREDVFAQDKKRGCHTCGQPGHHSAQCQGKPKEKQGVADDIAKVPTAKPFIFLDVSILREYLAVELSAPIHAFPFSLERAIDDWVFLIFFVGNDFLPHLPSLEIREGAIDVLMGIWKSSLEKMGGYLAESGKVHLGRAQMILEGLADREDDIFRKRKEAEERQDRGDKRRKIEAENRQNGTHLQNSHDYVPVRPVIASTSTLPVLTGAASLPARPTWNSMGMEVKKETKPVVKKEEVAKLVAGGNSSIVANRKAIRMANLNAAEMLKAELAGGMDSEEETKPMLEEEIKPEVEEEIKEEIKSEGVKMEEETTPRGTKRKAAVSLKAEEQVDASTVDAILNDTVATGSILIPGVGGAQSTTVTTTPPIVVNGMMAEQEDTVKLWEPGYKERYYRQKFGVELGDSEFRAQVVKCYVEGLCWVLEYYFQGTPSWQWYYPYHFSPFASDFVEVGLLDIQFTLGAPFKPYEQLMGVFPSASRFHLPTPFQSLMIEDESPIIDFYPQEFSIDMNGKKMAWQGVALLPFIDPIRLLDAMGTKYPELSDDENNRNLMGADTLFVGQDHPLYDYLEGLYTKRKIKEPVALDTKRSKGIAGAVLPDPLCIPGATYDSPLPSLNDIFGDRSISAQFSFPPQLTPHQSILLPNVKKPIVTLNSYDKDTVRRGGGERSESNGFHQSRGREDRGPGFAKMDNRGRGGGYQGGNNGRGNYQGRGGSDQSGNGGRDPYGGYEQRGAPPQQVAYGYGQARPNNGYQGAAPSTGGYGGGYGGQQNPPPQQQQQLYGSNNLGANQGQYGYGNNGSNIANQGAPGYSGYGGYGSNNQTNPSNQHRRY